MQELVVRLAGGGLVLPGNLVGNRLAATCLADESRGGRAQSRLSSLNLVILVSLLRMPEKGRVVISVVLVPAVALLLVQVLYFLVHFLCC